MKKLLRSLLAVMLIAMMALSFTSCAKPEKVEDKLKDMDYDVELYDDEDDLEDWADIMDCGDLKAVLEVECEEEDCWCEATIFWFEKKDDAKDFVEEMEKYIKELKKEMEEWGDYMDDEIPEVASKGKVVVFGYGDAFDDACDVVNAK